MIVFFLVLSIGFQAGEFSPSPPIKLEKLGELKSISAERMFHNIDDLCFDNDGNLYVSDSGRNEICIFDKKNNLLAILGTEGQGSGELFGLPGKSPIYLSHGGIKLLYVTDFGNRRLTVFDKSRVVYEYSIPKLNMNKIVGDDFGCFYVIDGADKDLITCHRMMDKKEVRFFGYKNHFYYPLSRPPWEQKIIAEGDIQIEIEKTGNHDVIVFSNHSLNAFRCAGARANKIITINQKEFLEDFGARLMNSIKANSFINPMRFHLDTNGNLCFAYYNRSKGRDEPYIYNNKGNYLGMAYLPRRTTRVFGFSENGNLYIVEDATKIGIYDYANSKFGPTKTR
jgi:hypothetical protein